MALFCTSFSIYPPTISNTTLFDVRTSATDYAIIRMFEIIGVVGSSTGGQMAFGIGTPATIGGAKANGIMMLSEDGSPPPNISIGTEWTVMPSIPTNYLRRFLFYNVFNGGMLRLELKLKLAPSSSLSLVLISMTAPNQKSYIINLGVEA